MDIVNEVQRTNTQTPKRQMQNVHSKDKEYIYIYNTWKIRTLEKVSATFLYKQNNYIYKEYIPTHYMLTKKKTHYIKKRK